MKEWQRNLILVVAAITMCVAALEFATRLLVDPVSRVNFTTMPRSILMRPAFAGAPYILRPNGTGKQNFGSNPHGYFDADNTLTYHINSLGFRGKETTREKIPGTTRIIVLGDSFTFGTGVRAQDTLPAQLEKMLDSGDHAAHAEVLNLGVGGYNTAHETALLANLGLALDPDIVVICYFLNDTNAGGTARAFGRITPEKQLAFWRRHSRLVDVIASRFERQRAADQLVRDYLAGFDEYSPGWEKSRNALRQAQQLSRQHNARLVLAIYPVLWKLSDDYPFRPIHKTITEFANSIQLPVVDLLPAFHGHNGPELWVHPNNQHPDPEAQGIAARALGDFLLKTYPDLLKPRK